MQEPQESISIETSQILAAQAKVRGLTVDEYLKTLLGINRVTPENASLDEFMAAMESLSEGTEFLPPSAINYTREDIYFDRD